MAWAWPIVEPGKLLWSWHLDYLCAHFQAQLERGRFGKPWAQNVLYNVPPGTSKSSVANVFAQPWLWLWDPSWKGIFASANPDISQRDSVKMRDLITSDRYQKTFRPRWSLSLDQNAKNSFTNTALGFRVSRGTEAKIVGMRGDGLVIDDPNDAQEVHSKASRDSVNGWWDGSAGNRLNNLETGIRAIIMQRVHTDDLAGHVLAGGDFEHVKLPMEYEVHNPCVCKSCVRGTTFLGMKDPRTKEGELLDPVRFPKSVLEGEFRRLRSAGYAGQMQQRPTSAEGNFFRAEWWQFYSTDGRQYPRPQGATQAPPKLLPVNARFDNVIQSWDCSFRALDHSDFVCGLVLGKIGADRYILDVKWERLDFTQTCEAILAMRKRWPRARTICIEAKANGDAVINTLARKITGIVPIDPEGGKEARAAACSPTVESGNVFVPEGAPWLDRFFAEGSAFPLGKHDDFIDALSQGLLRLEGSDDVNRARALLGQRV
jgi:predicted phage terminase large subunit-like protein